MSVLPHVTSYVHRQQSTLELAVQSVTGLRIVRVFKIVDSVAQPVRKQISELVHKLVQLI